MAPPDGLSGGDRLMAELAKISTNLANAGGAPTVSVGFLEGSTYPDGTSIPMVAATNEFGGTIQVQEDSIMIYRKVNAAGTMFMRNGRFVKKKDSNFASAHVLPAHTITIPPRPYFRTMIKDKGPTWPAAMAKLLKSDDYDAKKTLGLMGELIKGQLQDSIKALTSPPNAASTVRAKGFSKPLIGGKNDSGGGGIMWNSVGVEVST